MAQVLIALVLIGGSVLGTVKEGQPMAITAVFVLWGCGFLWAIATEGQHCHDGGKQRLGDLARKTLFGIEDVAFWDVVLWRWAFGPFAFAKFLIQVLSIRKSSPSSS